MNVVLVGLELAPGLVRTPMAETLSLLAKALRLLDFEVTVVLPYSDELRALGVLAARRLTPLEVPAFGPTFVYEASLPSGAQLCFLESKHRSSLPLSAFEGGGDEDSQRWFADAVVRYVSEQARKGAPPDVVHAMGLRAGLSLGALRTEDGAIGRVLTVGDASELEWAQADVQGSRLSALHAAECIVTPSNEIAESVREALRTSVPKSRATVQAIFEGVDTGVHNPATDTALPFRYTPYDRLGKRRSAQKERETYGLSADPERPLLAVRQSSSPGEWHRLLLRAVPAWVRQGFVVAVVDPSARRSDWSELTSQLAGQLVVLDGSAPAATRRLAASADFWLEPASTDTTGRAVLEAQRYGAVPVLGPDHRGRERVIELDGELSSGTGFTFAERTEVGLAELGGRLWGAFRRPRFGDVVERIMALDFAWDRAGRRHAQIYRGLVDGPAARSRELG